MFCLPGENEVLERLANLFVSGDFGRVSCERGATCNIAQPSKSLEEKLKKPFTGWVKTYNGQPIEI